MPTMYVDDKVSINSTSEEVRSVKLEEDELIVKLNGA